MLLLTPSGWAIGATPNNLAQALTRLGKIVRQRRASVYGGSGITNPRTMSRYAMAVIAAMLFSIISSTTAHAQEYRIEPVVIEGDPAPGFPGANLARFHNDVILNNSGEILFKSGIDSDPADLGIWIVRENGIFPVAISGDIVPVDAKGAATDFQISNFRNMALNDRGNISFHAFA